LKGFEELEKEKKETDSRNEQLKKEIDTLRKRLRDHFDEYHVEPELVFFLILFIDFFFFSSSCDIKFLFSFSLVVW